MGLVLVGGLVACGKEKTPEGGQVLPPLQEPFPTFPIERKTIAGGVQEEEAGLRIIRVVKEGNGQLDCRPVAITFPRDTRKVTSGQILERLSQIHEVEGYEVPPLRMASEKERKVCWQQTGIANQPCFVLDLSK